MSTSDRYLLAMERVYQSANGILQNVQIQLGQLEKCGNQEEASKAMENIQMNIREVDQHVDRLDIIVSKEVPSKRQMLRIKVDQLKADAQRVNLAASTMMARMSRQFLANKEREELLKQRFRPNESTVVSLEDHELQVNDRLHSSNRQVDDLISQGAAVLESLKSQGMNLRGVRRKMMDIGAALGLSSTTLKMIDRRVQEDWVIFVAGCIVCLIFMYTFYRFWKF